MLDQNDNVPAFARKSYHASVAEGLPAGAEVLRVAAFDPDEGPNGDVAYSLTEDSSQGAFSVDAVTGVIRTTRALDREQRAQYTLRAVATDGCARGPLSSVASVTVQVEDANDNVPVCEHNPVSAWVSVRTLPNEMVATVTATDADQGENGTIRFTLHDDENLFGINSESGEISLRRQVRAGFSGRKLHVGVSDRGRPALTSTCLVFIHLKGEHAGLQFTVQVYNATVKENSRAGRSTRCSSCCLADRTHQLFDLLTVKAPGSQRWRRATEATADNGSRTPYSAGTTITCSPSTVTRVRSCWNLIP